jgi:hypothetical protein
MKKEIVGYYWDKKDSWIIYQYPNGTIIREKK